MAMSFMFSFPINLFFGLLAYLTMNFVGLNCSQYRPRSDSPDARIKKVFSEGFNFEYVFSIIVISLQLTMLTHS